MDLYKEIIDGNLQVHQQEALFYDKVHGEIYNWHEQNRIKKDIEKVLFFSPGKAALDIGCGTGNLTIKLLELGCQVIAVDLSQPMIDILQKKIARNKNKKAVTLICDNIDVLVNTIGETFDVITISSVLHHLPDYLPSLEKITRLLNKKGVIYITHEPFGKERNFQFFRRLLYIIDFNIWSLISGTRYNKLPKIDYSFSDYQIDHGFDSNLVINCLSENGCNILKLR